MAPHLIWFLSKPPDFKGPMPPHRKIRVPPIWGMPYMVLRNRPGSITLPIFTFIRKYGEVMPLPNPVPLQIMPSPIPFLHFPFLHSRMEGTAGTASARTRI